MRTVSVCLLLALSLFARPALAAQSLQFQGERYEVAFSALGNANDRFIEHTRPGESVQSWTKLMVVHWYPNETAKPDRATNRLAILAKQRSESADTQLSENASANEAIVSFVLQSANRRVTEVNVFKYAPAREGRGLVAIQYAFRLPTSNVSASDLDRARALAFESLKTFDMNVVRASFGPNI